MFTDGISDTLVVRKMLMARASAAQLQLHLRKKGPGQCEDLKMRCRSQHG